MDFQLSARRSLTILLALLAAACVERRESPTAPGEPLANSSPSCGVRPNDTVAKLTECVTLDAVRAHQAALLAIANANGGHRAAGTAGHEASADYVAGLLGAAGYVVTDHVFQFEGYVQHSLAVLQQTVPTAIGYMYGVDHRVMEHSTSGDVTATATPVDVQLDAPASSTSGCEAADFAGFPAGNIALLQRGTCTFREKAENAANAGAAAAIIFNQDFANVEDVPVRGTVTSDYTGGIPVVSATFARGAEWVSTPGVILRIEVDGEGGTLTTRNIIAETPDGDPGNVVMIGGELDTAHDGPGIQNNGSGTAAILETALQMARVKPRNRVRFAWWARTLVFPGRVGSQSYLESLSAAERDAIALYIDVDQIAAPNYARFVLDGDGSLSGTTGVPGSTAIEAFFTDFYAARGLASEPYADHVSDWVSFFDQGIPVGGVTTGGPLLKTAAQAAAYGGTTGLPYDPCFSMVCDDLANVDLQTLDLNADAVAAAAITFAMNTEAVNGKKGKGNFKPKALQTGTSPATH